MSVNKFPPKFSQNILYPAIYNLDEYDMPQNDYYSGTYFTLQFGGYNVHASPDLTFGKHKFDIIILPNPDLIDLKPKSRILFEFKDYNGTVIYSDTTPYFGDNVFTGYVWVKQDPLRTYDDIVEGPGTMTIVAKTKNTDPQWRNRYNIRISHPIYISYIDPSSISSNIIYKENTSPLLFQSTIGSMGSGSGLSIEETTGPSLIEPSATVAKVAISASKLSTYSGEVKYVNTWYKVSGSVTNPQWAQLGSWQLESSSYENNIHKDFGWGINTLSEQWDHEIPANILPGSDETKIKFKLEFQNYYGDVAKNPEIPTNNFYLEYPIGIDNWMTFGSTDLILRGETLQMPSVSSTNSTSFILETGGGQFSFWKEGHSINSKDGGQSFNDDGSLREISSNTLRHGTD